MSFRTTDCCSWRVQYTHGYGCCIRVVRYRTTGPLFPSRTLQQVSMTDHYPKSVSGEKVDGKQLMLLRGLRQCFSHLWTATQLKPVALSWDPCRQKQVQVQNLKPIRIGMTVVAFNHLMKRKSTYALRSSRKKFFFTHVWAVTCWETLANASRQCAKSLVRKRAR